MPSKHCTSWGALALAASLATPVAAELSAADIGKLGATLTPLGGEKAGNAAKTIPEWTGGLVKPVAGHQPGKHYADPFKDDKPTLSITGANADQHKAMLPEGAQAMLKKYPTYRMAIYPTRRSAAAPEGHYKETKECAAKAKLAAGGNGVVGCVGGIPFPIPKDGNEAIWNALLRYRGDTFAVHWSQGAVAANGDYALVKFVYENDFSYGNLAKPAAQRESNKILNYLQTTTSPARLNGQMLLVHETVDQAAQARTAWTFTPGQQKVRLAPNVAYDNPGTASDGLRTNDDFGVFNGATDRYDWKLLGKREMYVPYNSYRLTQAGLKYAELLKPGHLNPEAARYELHRVWVVEATLKPGAAAHIYAKRVFYIDEDSWQILASDKYDAKGALWRYSEQHSEVWYDIPTLMGTIEVHNDLQAGRYIAMGLRSEEKLIYEPIKRTPGDYNPASLRGGAR